ncbi:MAG: helix-turn-helix domain-containing protein [Prosthecobacter sp.]|jgi:predicted XRE-type DNA-binding protein|uniref:helix-turn-helix domain-containing protein n=1 Tax=Prosthecobacter sp. TaxID=1965333 RepID=UPI003900ABD6
MEYNQKDMPPSVRQFLEALETMHPSLSVVFEKGGDKTGDWWLDVGHRSGSFTVHWEPKTGFGLHPASDEAVFGELPPERYADTAMVLRRVEQLVDDGQVGVVGLRDLREVQGLSQAELANRLGIQQAAVSKVERRQDLHLDTLSAIVKALGGTLEMKVRFPGGEVPLRMAH